jgi:hypothetical protein
MQISGSLKILITDARLRVRKRRKIQDRNMSWRYGNAVEIRTRYNQIQVQSATVIRNSSYGVPQPKYAAVSTVLHISLRHYFQAVTDSSRFKDEATCFTLY